MGVADLQKVNMLAKELMRHGIAQNAEEAVAKAEQLLLRHHNVIASVSDTGDMSSNISNSHSQEHQEKAAIASAEHTAEDTVMAEVTRSHLPKSDVFETVSFYSDEDNDQKTAALNSELRSFNVKLDAVVKELLAMREDFKKLHTNFEDLKAALTKLGSAGNAQSQATPSQHLTATAATTVTEKPHPQAEQANRDEARKPSASMAKTAYTPEDVAIEKIFYFGQK